MPIDFSGDGTLLGQNVRTLSYNSSDTALEYTNSGTVTFKIADSGTTTAKALGVTGNVGFFNTTPTTKPTVTGSLGGNAALSSLVTALTNLGLITNSTTA